MTSTNNRVFANCVEHAYPPLSSAGSHSPSRLVVSQHPSAKTSPTPSFSNPSPSPLKRRDSFGATLQRFFGQSSVPDASPQSSSSALPFPTKENRERYFCRPCSSSDDSLSVGGKIVPSSMPAGTGMPCLIAIDEPESPYPDDATLTKAQQQDLDASFPGHDGHEVDVDGISRSRADVTLVYPAGSFDRQLSSSAHAPHTPAEEGGAQESLFDILKIKRASVLTKFLPTTPTNEDREGSRDTTSSWLSIVPSAGFRTLDPASADGQKELDEINHSKGLSTTAMLQAIHRDGTSGSSRQATARAVAATIPVSHFGILERSRAGEPSQPIASTAFVPPDKVVFYGMVEGIDDRAADAEAGDRLLLRKGEDGRFSWFERSGRSGSTSPSKTDVGEGS